MDTMQSRRLGAEARQTVCLVAAIVITLTAGLLLTREGPIVVDANASLRPLLVDETDGLPVKRDSAIMVGKIDNSPFTSAQLRRHHFTRGHVLMSYDDRGAILVSVHEFATVADAEALMAQTQHGFDTADTLPLSWYQKRVYPTPRRLDFPDVPDALFYTDVAVIEFNTTLQGYVLIQRDRLIYNITTTLTDKDEGLRVAQRLTRQQDERARRYRAAG